MSKHYALKAEAREQAGKGVARALRRADKVPAVIYGDKQAAVTIALPSKEVNLEYRKGHMFTTVCDLDLSGKKNLVLVRDVQVHPVTDFVEHIDFLRVTEKTRIAVDVPVDFINHIDSPGLDGGGVLNVVRHEIELLCSALNIPESIEVNLAGKEMGDAVNISDAKLPEGTEPVIKGRNFVIATIQEPKQYIEEEIKPIVDPAAEGAEGAAPAEGAEGADKAEGDKKAEAPAKEEKAKK